MNHWIPTFEEIGEARFVAAFHQVLNESKFRPDISEIRKAAGMLTSEQCAERTAKEALKVVFEAFRKHGPQLRPIIGEILNDGRDEDGRILQVPRRTPTIIPPVFSEATEAALLELGSGDRKAGVDVMARHPSLPWNLPKRMSDDPSENSSNNSFRNKLGRDIEAQWQAAYLNRVA